MSEYGAEMGAGVDARCRCWRSRCWCWKQPGGGVGAGVGAGGGAVEGLNITGSGVVAVSIFAYRSLFLLRFQVGTS